MVLFLENLVLFDWIAPPIEQCDDLQHNGMTNSETEMCKWK